MTSRELTDLKALLDDEIIDQDEYDEKRAELEAARPKAKKKAPAKKKKAPAKKQEDGYEGMSCAKLKAALKERGCGASGEKGVLIWRLKLRDRSEGVAMPDGRDPFSLKVGELKKEAARVGVSPMGTNDEMLEGLIDALAADAPEPEAAAGAEGSRGGESGGKDARAVATRVLALAEEDDWEAVLQLGAPGKPLSARSPLNDLKKAYKKLSLAIHPDRLRGFDGATRAFQALVTALDRLSNPAPAAEADGAAERKQRSNDGCARTDVRCPRCGEAWGASKSEGLPDYAYNFLMTGLKNYTCSTCLCEFGCVSAEHACAKCGGDFDYSPADYHRQIECGDCGRAFGFYEFRVSDRAMADAVKDARSDAEKRAKQRASKKRRADAQRRRGAARAEGAAVDAEACFLLGLSDDCPRCGAFFGEGASRSEKREHLETCVDAAAHAAKARASAASAARGEKRAADEERADAAQALATWEATGALTSTLWMLPDAALVEMAGGDDDARTCTRAELIARAAAARDGILRITDGSGAAPAGRAKRRKLTADSLPAGYANLTADELRGICAAHGFAPKGDTKDKVLHEIENELHDDKHAPLLLTSGKPAPLAGDAGGDDSESADDDFRPGAPGSDSD